MDMAFEPETPREILLVFDEKFTAMEKSVGESVDRLTDSVNKLMETMKEMEVNRIQQIEKRLAAIEAKGQELKGAWRVLAAIAGVVGLAIGYAIKYLSAK